MSDTYSYPVETYSWILNVDKTILKLNPVLEKYGFHFIVVSLEELERKFAELFGYPANYECDNTYTLNRFDDEVNWKGGDLREEIDKVRNEKLRQGFRKEDIESTISGGFYELLMHNVPGGYDLLRDHEVIFLKKIENFDNFVVNNTSNAAASIKAAKEISDFVRMLIQHMRLFKNGDVMCRTEFQIACDTRKLILRFKPSSFVTGAKKFIVNDDDVPAFESFLGQDITPNELAELALSTFDLAYNILDLKSRYLNYMICLESLFNRNTAEISHTIARHLSVIISKDEQEFNNNYLRIKKLYKYRNDIIHGSKIKEDIDPIAYELQDLVRQAINFCLKIEMDREQLFTHLNSRGF
jgi:hypothetical protein